jgi:NhaP-type Na+/H+ or K+/H+ antiporter
MFEQITHIAARISLFHLNVLLLLGLALFGGTIGGRLFQKLKIPQVVGYMIIGLLAGQSVCNLINEDVLRALQPFNYFALGLIAFSIGGELRRDFFQRYGKQVGVTLFTEAMIAFLFVTVAVGVVGTFLMKDAGKAWSLGFLLGAIAAATDAASTMHVFTEFKSRGPLTKTTLGIVALDDGLAFILFAIVSSIVTDRLGLHSQGMVVASVHLIYEIGGSILIGGVSAFILTKLLDHYTEEERIITFSIGMVLFVLGISLACNMDMLIAAMTLGAIITNVNPRRSKQLFEIMGRFTPPIYVLFFVLIGAAINIHAISLPLVIFVLCYIVARTIGKTLGARIGTKITLAPETVHKNLPFCLFSQASAAIGLAILGLQRFPGEVGTLIMMTITMTTMVL